MVKRLGVAAGTFALSAMVAGTVAFAQTATPAPTVSPTPTTNQTTNTTVTPSPTTTVPEGAPSTGRF